MITLDKIPMDVFVDVFLGDLSALSSKGERSSAGAEITAQGLIHEYMDIIGGASAEAELSKKNDIVNYRIRINCMNACNSLIGLNRWDDVCDILRRFGFDLPKSDHDKIRMRVSAILSNSRFNLDRLNSRPEKVGKNIMDRKYFIREIVAVETHFKMQINTGVTSAAKYAHYVKRMCDEIKQMNATEKSRKK